MLEDGTVFERKGFGDEQPLQFITDEGRFATNNSCIVTDLAYYSMSFPLMGQLKTEYNTPSVP